MITLVWITVLMAMHYSHANPSGHKALHLNTKKSFLEDAMKEMEYGDKGGKGTHGKEAGTNHKTNSIDTNHTITQTAQKLTRPNKEQKTISTVTKIFPSTLPDKKPAKKLSQSPLAVESNKTFDRKINKEIRGEVREIVSIAKKINVKALTDATPGMDKKSETSTGSTGKGSLSYQGDLNPETVNVLQKFVENMLHDEAEKRKNSANAETIGVDGNKTQSDGNLENKSLRAPISSYTKSAATQGGEKYQITPVYRLKAQSNSSAGKVSDDNQKEKQQELENLQQQAQKLLLQREKEEEIALKNAANINGAESKASVEGASSANPFKDIKGLGNGKLKELPRGFLEQFVNMLKDKKPVVQVPKRVTEARKAYETARKLVKAAQAREQLYKAEQDFFEKVKEMMSKTEVKEPGQKNQNADETASKTINDGGDKTSEAASAKSLGSSLPLSTLTSANDLFSGKANNANDPSMKKFDEAAHMEEKVAQQQDQMYEALIHNALRKSFRSDEDDDENEEPGIIRGGHDTPEEEDYGDFQDKDEEAQKKSLLGNGEHDGKNDDTTITLRSHIAKKQNTAIKKPESVQNSFTAENIDKLPSFIS
ncbi:uncharacterized protein LOC125559016 [Nematostella vectensis]|uniref:uncharacterized protein LOC125559016 n=1 Tax=Nematostella vectensis TaxID=45351 RepID=UPI0020772647|nr:uncharacterized protein LOC125559016 [Nematostella vectensis]